MPAALCSLYHIYAQLSGMASASALPVAVETADKSARVSAETKALRKSASTPGGVLSGQESPFSVTQRISHKAREIAQRKKLPKPKRGSRNEVAALPGMSRSRKSKKSVAKPKVSESGQKHRDFLLKTLSEVRSHLDAPLPVVDGTELEERESLYRISGEERFDHSTTQQVGLGARVDGNSSVDHGALFKGMRSVSGEEREVTVSNDGGDRLSVEIYDPTTGAADHTSVLATAGQVEEVVEGLSLQAGRLVSNFS